MASAPFFPPGGPFFKRTYLVFDRSPPRGRNFLPVASSLSSPFCARSPTGLLIFLLNLWQPFFLLFPYPTCYPSIAPPSSLSNNLILHRPTSAGLISLVGFCRFPRSFFFQAPHFIEPSQCFVFSFNNPMPVGWMSPQDSPFSVPLFHSSIGPILQTRSCQSFPLIER